MAKLYSADRDERRGAAEAMTEALAPGLRTRTFVFNTILVDKSIDDRLRGYETWISSRNLRNDTTDEAVHALIDAAVSRYDVPQRYYRLKAKLLELDRLTFYDRFAPIAEDPSKVSWDEARDIVVSTRTRLHLRDRRASSIASSARAGSTPPFARTSGPARSARPPFPASTLHPHELHG